MSQRIRFAVKGPTDVRGLDRAETGRDGQPVWKAAAVVPRSGPGERMEAALAALAESRLLELELCTVPRAIGRSPPWAAATLCLPWIARSALARPQVVIGAGARVGAVAVAAGRIVGSRSVIWFDGWRPWPSAGLLRSASEVWSADDEATRWAASCGVRAFRALLTPPAAAIPGPGAVPRPGRLLVAGPLPAQPALVLGPLGESRAQVSVLGPPSAAWAPLRPRHVPENERVDALLECSALLSLNPDRDFGVVVEALLLGRPVLVPADRRPACIGEPTGAVFSRGRPESLLDAVAEVWAGLERGRFEPRAMRRIGEAEALEARLPAFAQRLMDLAATRPLSEP